MTDNEADDADQGQAVCKAKEFRLNLVKKQRKKHTETGSPRIFKQCVNVVSFIF